MQLCAALLCPGRLGKRGKPQPERVSEKQTLVPAKIIKALLFIFLIFVFNKSRGQRTSFSPPARLQRWRSQTSDGCVRLLSGHSGPLPRFEAKTGTSHCQVRGSSRLPPPSDPRDVCATHNVWRKSGVPGLLPRQVLGGAALESSLLQTRQSNRDAYVGTHTHTDLPSAGRKTFF